MEGPLSKWWYFQVAQTRNEVGRRFSGVSEMERALIQEFCGIVPAEQARLNSDKARQKTTVLTFVNHYREQSLELPYRHEGNNVQDFHRGLRPLIHKELPLRTLRTYPRRFKQRYERKQHRPRLRQPNARRAG
jgi:uncharacterized protein YbgA (DUF1722 family)